MASINGTITINPRAKVTTEFSILAPTLFPAAEVEPGTAGEGVSPMEPGLMPWELFATNGTR
jgi:hypothetical protein